MKRNSRIARHPGGNNPAAVGMPHMLTVSEMAGALRSSDRSILRAITEGSIRATRVGRRWLVSAAELQRLLGGE
jgi:excisionase family DNA binding protein